MASKKPHRLMVDDEENLRVGKMDEGGQGINFQLWDKWVLWM